MDAGQSRSAPVAARVESWIVALAFVALTAWWLWPLPLEWTDHAIYPASTVAEVAADYRLITWALAWDTHALLTRPAGLFDANVFHPAPLALAFSEHFLGYLPLFAPTYLATGNPVLASNVLIFATYPLCALAMYALARRFVAAPAAFLAGAAYAFCGLRYHNLYHFHQLGVFWLPLVPLFGERWLERARARDALLLAACVALQLLSSFYLAYALAALCAVYLPLALWHRRRDLDRRRVLGLGAAFVAGALPALLASLPYLELQRLGVIPSTRSTGLDDRFTMDPRLTMLQIERYLTQNGVGVVGMLLAALGLATGWRGGSFPRVLGVALCAAGLLLAAGPAIHLAGHDLWSPYELLYRWLPGFAAIRLPFRFLVVAQLGFALLAALGLAFVLAWLPVRLAWPAAAAAVALLLVGLGPLPPHALQEQATGARVPELYGWLAQHGEGGALLEIPPGDPATAAHRMVLGTRHWLPMLDGYSAYPPPSRNVLKRVALALPDPAAVQRLVNLVDVRWVAVHLGELDPAARRAWARPPRGLTPAVRFGDDVLFRVALAPTMDLRARFVSRTETLNGVPLAPLAERCPGHVGAVVAGAPDAVSPGAPYDLTLTVENRGIERWPGFSTFPRWVVQARVATVRAGRDEPESVAPVSLWRDVEPGQTVQVGTKLTAPRAPGDYVLDVSLVQDGAPLERCGVPPVRVPQRVAARPRA